MKLGEDSVYRDTGDEYDLVREGFVRRLHEFVRAEIGADDDTVFRQAAMLDALSFELGYIEARSVLAGADEKRRKYHVGRLRRAGMGTVVDEEKDSNKHRVDLINTELNGK